MEPLSAEAHRMPCRAARARRPVQRRRKGGAIRSKAQSLSPYCSWILVVSAAMTVLIGAATDSRAQSILETPSFPVRDPNLIAAAKAQQVFGTLAAEQEQDEPNDVGAKPSQPEEGPSAIELLMAGRVPIDVSTDLKQFGYEVFRRPVSTFAPVTSVPVGPDYVIGPGDGFTVTLWGRVNIQHIALVNRAGEITLPDLGVLKVAGMTFAQLEDYLRYSFSRQHTDFKLAITMGRLRTIRVYVVGEARAPSSYTLSSLSTAINALFAAGGPSKNGSMRNIKLSRSDQQPITIDLYDFLLGGDKSGDVRLQDGDTIHIPLIGPAVGVAGNVKRPAVYEMSGPMTLAEVLDLAGGVTHAGWLQRVQVQRVENHQRRVVVDFDMSSASGSTDPQQTLSTLIKDGDVIKVFPVLSTEHNAIFLEGHVRRPGTYQLKPGMRLADVLSSYDVVLPQPNLEYGEIERLVEPDLHPVVIPFNVQKVLDGDQDENIELADFDTVRLFKWDQRAKRAVRISGMVFDPNEYRLVPDMRLRDLVNSAGGLQKTAYLEKAELTRRHVSQTGVRTEKIDVDLAKAMAGDLEHNLLLGDYDHLIVRPIPELAFDRSATIGGEVMFPGTYPIRRGETLSSLIERAGGFTDRAYLKGSVFTRQSAKEIQRRRMDSLIRELEESILARGEEVASRGTDSQSAAESKQIIEARQELLAKLRAAQIDGRVVVKLAPLGEFRGSHYDLELEDGDNLVIPETPGFVSVVGEVFNPTSLLYEQGRTVRYYLNRVGGMTKDADKKQLSVIRADGSVVSIAQKRSGDVSWDRELRQWFFGGLYNAGLDPGDTIVVPRKMDKYLWMRTTRDITQIIFQIAVAAGVVLAI